MLYQYRNPQIQELDTTPDPLYNPNEVTRVKDILDLHARGVQPYAILQQFANEVVDERNDLAKIQSANLESDKLFPSLPRVVAQNAQYSNILRSDESRIRRLIDLQETLADTSNSSSSVNSET